MNKQLIGRFGDRRQRIGNQPRGMVLLRVRKTTVREMEFLIPVGAERTVEIELDPMPTLPGGCD